MAGVFLRGTTLEGPLYLAVNALRMKRPFRCLLVFSVVAVIAAYSWKVWESEAAYQWQEMPKGDAVRLQQVTYGRKHEFRSEKVWLERFSEAIHSRSLRPLSAGNLWSGYSPDTNVPSTVVLLRCRTANIPSIGDSTLSLPKGQTFWIGTHSASGNGQGVIIRFEFPFVPNHGEELRFTTTLNGQHYAFEFRHPIHPASPTTWKAAPLPQTQTNGAVSLTLNALTLEYVANAIRFFDWKARFAGSGHSTRSMRQPNRNTPCFPSILRWSRKGRRSPAYSARANMISPTARLRPADHRCR